MAKTTFGNILEKIKSAPRRYVQSVKRKNAEVRQYNAKKELDDISRAFGSVENYEKLYPETKKRHDALRKEAGY